MPEKKSAMEEFLGEIPVAEQQGDAGSIFEKPLIEGQAPEQGGEELVPTNRVEKRLRSRLQAEREANIAMAAKLEAISEREQFSRDFSDGKVDETLLKLYGDNENGRQAAKLTQELLDKTKAQAREEALAAFAQEEERENQEVAQNQDELDSMLEVIEDEYNVDLTSNTPQAKRARQGFYSALEELSPKNAEGMVTDYADPISTWKYLQLQTKPDNRAKDLASRSMVRSGSGGEQKLEATVQERFLKDAGII